MHEFWSKILAQVLPIKKVYLQMQHCQCLLLAFLNLDKTESQQKQLFLQTAGNFLALNKVIENEGILQTDR